METHDVRVGTLTMPRPKQHGGRLEMLKKSNEPLGNNNPAPSGLTLVPAGYLGLPFLLCLSRKLSQLHGCTETRMERTKDIIGTHCIQFLGSASATPETER